MAKYTLPFSKSAKSNDNYNFRYFQNNHIKTTKIFSVRSIPVRAHFWKVSEAEVYRSLSVGVDSGRSLNNFRK